MRVVILTSPTTMAQRADMADTFVQAREIAGCLAALGHESVTVAYGSGSGHIDVLREVAPHIVFNLVEDVPEGPDQIHGATALLDRHDLAYTGASTGALRKLGNKTAVKTILKRAGLPVARGLADGDAATRYIVKSAIEHASLGLGAENVVTGAGAAMVMIARRQGEFGGEWFAEAYIDGREFNVAMLEGDRGPAPLPIAEILFTDHEDGRPKIVGYAEKWDARSAAYDSTPRVFPPREEKLFAELERLALAAWRLFALSGYARIDFRVDRHGRPFILEVNANPCLAADAGFCAAAAECGLSQTDVVDTILQAARG